MSNLNDELQCGGEIQSVSFRASAYNDDSVPQLSAVAYSISQYTETSVTEQISSASFGNENIGENLATYL